MRRSYLKAEGEYFSLGFFYFDCLSTDLATCDLGCAFEVKGIDGDRAVVPDDGAAGERFNFDFAIGQGEG